MSSIHGSLGLRVLVPVAVALGAAVAAPVVMGAPQQPAGLGKALLATPGFQAGAERSKQRLDRRDSEEAKAQRRASRERYRRATRAEALAAGKLRFPEEFAGRLFDGLRPAAGLQVAEHLDDNAAIVKDPQGRKLLMRSTLPLRARTPGGKLAPVDLSLRESAEAFATANSNADLSIAKKAGDGTEFVAGGFSIAPETDVQAAGGIESDGRVFYDDVTGTDSDTAFMVSPQPTGAELSWLLLSAQAPESLVLKVDLPAGAVLRRTQTDHPIPNDPPSTLEIVRGDRALGYIEAPLVYDADGVSVQSDMRIEGTDRIVISVDHHERDLSYPLYVDPEVTVAASKTAGWYGWRNAQYPSPASQSVNYYGWALNDPAYNASGVYMSMPSNTWFSPSGTAASWTYQAPANTYIYRAIFGGMDHTPLRDGYAFSLWYQGLANSPYSWEPNVSYANQSGGFGGNPFGPAAHAAQGQTHDFCFNTRCDRGQGSEQNIAHLGLAASNPYTGQAFYTYGYRAKLTMNWANILLGDRLAPTFRNSAPPSSGWENDNAGEHDPGLIAVSDQGLGLTGVTLSGAASGNGTIRELACTGDPQRDPCPKTLDTAGFRYRLNEGQTTLTLTAKDIVDNIVSQTWTKKIDRSKPQLEVNGWLPNTDGLIFTGIDYDLSIAASDSVSGVKSIEVLVDGQRMPENGFKQQDCGADGCDLILNTTLIAGSYDPGPHTVRIVAKDFADNEERVELAVDISDVAAAPPRERDPISDELGEDAPEPPAEPGIDTTCDPTATDGSDVDCVRDDLTDPIEQAVSNEPGLIENVLTPLLNTLDELLSGPQARAAGSLAKNGSGWGLSDQKAQTFVPDDPATPEREGYLDLFTPLDVTRLRLVVPWDLVPRAKGTFNGDPYPKSFEHRDPNEPRPVVGLGGRLGRLKATDEWIARALPCDPDKRLGEVMISFEKSESLSDDPDDVRHENLLPTTNEYVYAVGEFRKRYLGRCQADKDKDETSKITVFTAWNEPNFGKQPTRGNRLDRAGAYWSQLNRICKTTPITAYRCTVAAGDFIDARYSSDPNFGLNGDVRRYARGMNRPASTWALHAYGTSHAPFAEAETRIKRFLKLTKSQSGHEPRLWLTEQGGRFNVPDTEPAPTPAADFCNLMQFRNISNRITRFYYYPLVGPPPDADGVRRNDSALIALNADNSITPRDPQYETYKFYASKTGGIQRC